MAFVLTWRRVAFLVAVAAEACDESCKHASLAKENVLLQSQSQRSCEWCVTTYLVDGSGGCRARDHFQHILPRSCHHCLEAARVRCNPRGSSPQVQEPCENSCLNSVFRNGQCRATSHFRHLMPGHCSHCVGKAMDLCDPVLSRRRTTKITSSTTEMPTTQQSVSDLGEKDCQTAVQGDDCYPHVMWALQTGINQHPEWYPGLNKVSTFQDFQEQIHSERSEVCPRPCPAVASCATPEQGEECHKHVTWAMEVGFKTMPQTYQGLSAESTFEDFQDWMHRMHYGRCPAPSCREHMG